MIALASTKWNIQWAVACAFGVYLALWIVLTVVIFIFFFLRFHLTKGALSHFPRPANTSQLALFDMFNVGGIDRALDSLRNDDGTFPKCTYNGAYFDGSHAVSICDADAIQKVMKTEVDAFPKFPPIYDTYASWVGNGLVFSKGALWKKQRTLLNNMFQFQRLTNHCHSMASCIQKFIDSLPERDECKHVDHPGVLLHSHEEFKDLTLRIIIECSFGGDIDGRKVSKLFVEWTESQSVQLMIQTFFGPTLSHFFPVPWKLIGLRSMFDIKDELDALTLESIRRKRASWSAEGSQCDLLSEMFLAEERSGEQISDVQIQAEMFVFLLAGSDTSSSTLAFAMQCIAEHKEVQSRIHEEVDAIPELKDRTLPITNDILKHLPYTRAVLHEVLRQFPIVPYLERLATESCELVPGLHIPAGTVVLMWFRAVANDPTYWKDPTKFDPLRFLRGSGATPEKHHPFAYNPFSAGPRNCIGRNFALQELILVVAMLAAKYEFTLVKKGVPTFETTMVCHGGEVRLTDRGSSK